jgi:sulfatase modifying factor 1
VRVIHNLGVPYARGMGVDHESFSAVPGGSITMRDARTGGSRDVLLQPFAIRATPVLFREFARAADATDSTTSPLAPAHAVTWFAAVRWCNDASLAAGLTEAYAVDGRAVTWDPGANGYRLPTEAEWEYASRAGTTTPAYGPLDEIAWSAADGVDGPQEAALKQANALGLYDTIGNVWEWCWDYADTARYGDYRALRGGGWADQAWSCRASVRRGSAPDAVLEDVGFRVARGAVGERGALEAQGWSAAVDRERADIRGPLPIGWTPLRSLLR